MVFRFLLRYLANNEQLVQKIADSYAMRRAAQIVVAAMYRGKNVAEDLRIGELTPEKFKRFINAFQSNVKDGIEDAKRQIKRK